MSEAEKERLIKKDIESIENRVRHAFNQGYEMGLKENKEQSGDAISRQAALDAMYALCNTDETLKDNPWRDNPHIDAITDAIEDLPSVSPQQRTGRWNMAEGLQRSRSWRFWASRWCVVMGYTVLRYIWTVTSICSSMRRTILATKGVMGWKHFTR